MPTKDRATRRHCDQFLSSWDTRDKSPLLVVRLSTSSRVVACTAAAAVEFSALLPTFNTNHAAIITSMWQSVRCKTWSRGLASFELYQKLQSVHRARNCGVHILPLTVHYGPEKLGKELSDFDPNELDLTFQSSVTDGKWLAGNKLSWYPVLLHLTIQLCAKKRWFIDDYLYQKLLILVQICWKYLRISQGSGFLDTLYKLHACTKIVFDRDPAGWTPTNRGVTRTRRSPHRRSGLVNLNCRLCEGSQPLVIPSSWCTRDFVLFFSLACVYWKLVNNT